MRESYTNCLIKIGAVLLLNAMIQSPLYASATEDGLNPALVKLSGLISKGQFREADRVLRDAQSSAARLSNPQLKFFRCLLFTQQGAIQKAIACYQDLIREHPDMPEPYNNLGVLLASRGQLVEARSWLERGLKQSVPYATLNQNILNLQTEINRGSYQAALQISQPQEKVRPKLAMLGFVGAIPRAPEIAASNPSVAVSPDLPIKNELRSSAIAGAGQPHPGSVIGAPAIKTMDKLASAQVDSGTPVGAAKNIPPSEEELVKQHKVREAVQNWVEAWRKKDIENYLLAYSPKFVPTDGMSRRNWQEQRRQRIVSKKSIKVDLDQLRITFNHSKAIATFIQAYEAGTVRAVGHKTLELIEEDGRWVILSEYVGNK